MKKIKNIIYLILFSCFLNAQTVSSLPAFIVKEKNHLHLGADSAALRLLFSKMDLLKGAEGTRLNIVHFGGSHVQAGIWSNAMAATIQSNFETMGGGYFGFPYKLAKTNGQYYLNSYSTANWKKCRAVRADFCLPLGLSGLSVATNDSAGTFGAALNVRSTCRFVNNVRVYHNFNPSFEFHFKSAPAGKFERRDNLEGGYSLFSFENPIDSLQFEFARLDTNQRDFILYGFSLENDLVSGVFLAALGLNGASVPSFLRCSELKRQLPSLKADVFFLSLGVNDTQAADFTEEKFYQNYDSLITVIRSVSPTALIVLTTTTDNYIHKKTLNKKTVPARDAMYRLMNDRQVAVWDIFEIMGGPKSIVKWGQLGLASKDRVHFTTRGYNILGTLMAESLLELYHTNKKVN